MEIVLDIPPLSPVSLLFTIVMCLIVLTAKRENIVIPLLMTGCFMTTWQMIVFMGFNFPMLRFVICICILRLTLKGEWSNLKINEIDKIIICYMIIKMISYTILWSTTSALVYILGQTVDTVGAYFIIRTVIHDYNDYDRIINSLIIMSIPIAIFMVYEQLSGGFNIFSLLGGVPEISAVRNGKLRAQGAFDHAILAGTFGASLLPLSWGIRQRGYKKISQIGFITSFVITLASSSSGPIMTILFSIIGILLWFTRNYTKLIRNLFYLSLVLLHLIMKAPIWALIARIDIVGGSTGDHRYRLIDAAINNLSQWMFIGIRSTEVWGTGLWDITNQYIIEGARGGIITMILFIVIMGKCFSTVGTTRKKFKNRPDLQKYAWTFGVLLFAYAWSFLSVSFFGQMQFFYYLLIAMMSSLKNLPDINTPDTI